jgi:glycosyltransferase involved in cell wall biosynthesis
MKIEWLISGTSPVWVEENYQDGGYVYDTYARKILRDNFELNVTYISRGNSRSKIKRFFEFAKYICRNSVIRFKGDIIIHDAFSTVFAPFDKNRKHIVILHHLDVSSVNFPTFYHYFIQRFFKKIFLADKVIVVSEYWENILKEAGYSKIIIIYNAFDLNLFRFKDEELSEFRKKYNFSEKKPIIYLGNAKLEKGFLDAYEVLKNIDATFVTTGKNHVHLPIVHKYLSYSDYLKLLKISSLVITMSKFNEGWCRTAHEAMLCGTPVIGSGKGGMKELLEKGSQIICEDFGKLNQVVTNLLSNREKLNQMAVKGKAYASTFTLEYFRKSWIELISSLKNKT